MKYIDVKKLIAEIERLKATNPSEYNYQNAEGYIWALEDIKKFIDSLQQEQQELPNIAEYYYHKGVYEGLSKGRADALKILEESMKRKADPVIVIKQQEQQEVDLNENTMKKEFRMIDSACLLFNYDKLSREQLIARHFYALGKNSK